MQFSQLSLARNIETIRQSSKRLPCSASIGLVAGRSSKVPILLCHHEQKPPFLVCQSARLCFAVPSSTFPSDMYRHDRYDSDPHEDQSESRPKKSGKPVTMTFHFRLLLKWLSKWPALAFFFKSDWFAWNPSKDSDSLRGVATEPLGIAQGLKTRSKPFFFGRGRLVHESFTKEDIGTKQIFENKKLKFLSTWKLTLFFLQKKDSWTSRLNVDGHPNW